MQGIYLIKSLHPEYVRISPDSKIRTNNAIKKWAKHRSRYFIKMKKANKYMKMCLATLVIKEMQIKTMMTYRYRPIRMATIKGD